MPSQLTFTGKTGPASQLTARVFLDVRRMAFDFDKRTLQVNHQDPIDGPKELILDISGATVTLTDTVTGNQHVFVMSVT